MSTYTQDQLREIVGLHGKWLRGEAGGKRADLSYADLRDADLRGANLRHANLRDAVLRGANLRGANLRDAVLCYADLRGAKLRGANLRGANLRGAYMAGVDLRDADLRGADLRSADLTGAIGVVLLPACDMRGYSHPHAVLCGNEWRVRAGCRDFSIAQAREHWGDQYQGAREQGDIYLRAIDWLEAWIERHGHEHMEKAA